VRWFGAEDNAFTRAAARKWACAAVARVFRPGCQMDNMLVLVGGQGIGKSRFPKIMAKDPTWFSDSVPNMDGNKSSFEPLRGKWIIEIAELAATKRSEMDAIKNFVTKPVDSYRPAYGEVLEDFPRQCVFWGTTNDAEFLKDRTGDRRFWPVEVAGVDHGRMNGLENEVDQLWAEAVVRWRAGESLWMDTPELQRLAAEAQATHSAQDEQVGQILEFLDTPLPNNWHELDKAEKRAYFAGSSVAELGVCQRRRNDICVAELRWELFGEEQKNRGRSLELAGIMNNLPGWKKLPKSYRVPGWGPQKVYRRIDAMPQPAFEGVSDPLE
jgi:predicted P-loop ATPase